MTTADSVCDFLNSAPQRRRALVVRLIEVLIDLRRWDQYDSVPPAARAAWVQPDTPRGNLERHRGELQRELLRLQ